MELRCFHNTRHSGKEMNQLQTNNPILEDSKMSVILYMCAYIG